MELQIRFFKEPTQNTKKFLMQRLSTIYKDVVDLSDLFFKDFLYFLL